jgi:hypothetical protein
MKEEKEMVWAEEMCLQVWIESNWSYGLGDSMDLPSGFDLEREIIKRDLFRKLSESSREIIRIVLESEYDPEILKSISTPRTGNITKRSLSLFLQEVGIPLKTIVKSFKELHRLANNL